MERINLSVLSGASHDGMLQLKSYVDMTGSDPQHQSYDYECLFPETCNPREICLSFTKSADKYIFRVNPHFRYDGSNSVMGMLADTGTVSFTSWQDAEQALRSLSEEGTKPTTSNATPDTLTDYKDSMGVLEEKESAAEPIVQELEKLQSASTKTSGSMSKMGGLVEKLNSIYPELNASVDKNTGNFKINGREIKDLSDYMSDYSEELKNAARAQAIFDEQTELYKAEAQKKRLKKELETQIDEANGIAEKEFDGSYLKYTMSKLADLANGKNKSTKASEWEAIWDEVRKGKEEYEKLDAQIEEHKGNLDELENEQKKVTEATKQQNASVEKSCEGLTGAGVEADRASEKYVELSRRIKDSGNVNVPTGGGGTGVSQEKYDSLLKALQTQTQAYSFTNDDITSLREQYKSATNWSSRTIKPLSEYMEV